MESAKLNNREYRKIFSYKRLFSDLKELEEFLRKTKMYDQNDIKEEIVNFRNGIEKNISPYLKIKKALAELTIKLTIINPEKTFDRKLKEQLFKGKKIHPELITLLDKKIPSWKEQLTMIWGGKSR